VGSAKCQVPWLARKAGTIPGQYVRICGGQSGIGTGFFRVLRLPLSVALHTIAQYRLMTSPTLRASQLNASLNITPKYCCQMLLGLFLRLESYLVDLLQKGKVNFRLSTLNSIKCSKNPTKLVPVSARFI
jgi:hypothetical protein